MAETATITERTTIPIYSAEELSETAARALTEARGRVAAIEALPLEGLSAEAVFDAWDAMSVAIEDAFGTIWLLNSVHPDAAVRDAADRVVIDESVFMTELFQNETLYEVPSFAHYVTKRRMVGDPETVTSFLDEVKAAVTEAELRDLGILAEKKAEMTV